MDKIKTVHQKNIQTVDDWYEILCWENLPNFGPCHQLSEYSLFNKNYYSCDEIIRLQVNIFEIYKNGNMSSVKLMGDPGSGKTSFLYYLIQEAKNTGSELINEYSVHVFSVSKADDQMHYDRIIQKEIIIALKVFFSECGMTEKFKETYDIKQSRKENINDLLDFIADNKNIMKKKLIFVLDDVDLLDPKLMENIAKSVQRHLDSINVIKWISVRGTTYEKYHKELKDFLNEFYPTVYTMPPTTLFSIIQYRIMQFTNKLGKNPFSKYLCDKIIDPLVDYNKRRSLGMLKSIIEDTLPKQTHLKTDERFIQQFVNTSSINSLMYKGVLPNIHQNHMRSISFYPLPYDILLCLQYSNNPNVVFGSINDIARKRCEKTEIWDNSRIIKIRESDFIFSVNALESESLVSSLSKSHIELTPRGKTVAHYVSNSGAYADYCRGRILEVDNIDEYWDFLHVPIDHQKTVSTYLSWVNQYHEPET